MTRRVLLCLLLWSAVYAVTAEPTLVLEDSGIDVVGTTEETQQVLVVDRQAIEEARAADVTDLLERTLGLVSVRNGPYGNQTGVRLRGFGSGRVAILIDGVPVNSTQSGDFDLSRVEVASLERIEVTPGGADTKHNLNGAVGGVINLITVRQPPEGITWGGSVSNRSAYPSAVGTSYLDTQALEVHAALGQTDRFWNLGFQAHRAANQFSFTDEEGATRFWTRNGVVDAGYWFSGSLPTGLGQRLLATSSGTWAEKRIPGPLGSAPAAAGVQEELSTRSSLVWSVGAVGSDSLGLDLTLRHTLTDLKWTDAKTETRHQLHTFGLAHSWLGTSLPWLFWTAGSDYDLSVLRSGTVGALEDGSGGAFVTGEFFPGERFQAIPSVKLVVASSLRAPIPVPKLGLVYRFASGAVLKHNWFRTFKLPTLNDRFWPEDATARGNPDLRPEDGWGTDLILSFPLARGAALEASGYATRHLDAILWQPVASRWTPTNVGEALYLGSDVTARWESGPWKLSLRYSYLNTWVLSEGLTWADNKRMPYTPVHSGGGNLSWKTSAGTFSASGQFEDKRYVSTLNLYPLAPRLVIDLGWVGTVGSGVTLFCDVKNLLNASYTSAQGYPMPGGSITAGLRFQSSPDAR